MIERRPAPRRGYVRVGEAQVHYRRAGPADSPALILLHQTPSTSAMYLPLMRQLAGRFDLIALDTPGFGLSDPLPGTFSIAAAAERLATAVASLRPGPCAWFGHHTGAALALQVAHEAPDVVASLAMSGPCLLDDAMKQALPKKASPVPRADDGSHWQILWDRIRAKDVDAPAAIIERDVLAALQAGDAYPQAYQAVTEVDTAAQLSALECPTLVLAGTEDPLYSALDAAYAPLRNGQRHEIAGARTFVCERNTETLAGILIDFLRDARSGANV